MRRFLLDAVAGTVGMLAGDWLAERLIRALLRPPVPAPLSQPVRPWCWCPDCVPDVAA